MSTRVVRDTNTWVSGLLWKGLPWRLLRLAEAGKVEICVAPAMVNKLVRVLSYEKRAARLRQLNLTPAGLLTYVMNIVSVFGVPRSGAVIVAADPDDDVFLQCAEACRSQYVVSGDHHLLEMGEYSGIPSSQSASSSNSSSLICLRTRPSSLRVCCLRFLYARREQPSLYPAVDASE